MIDTGVGHKWLSFALRSVDGERLPRPVGFSPYCRRSLVLSLTRWCGCTRRLMSSHSPRPLWCGGARWSVSSHFSSTSMMWRRSSVVVVSLRTRHTSLVRIVTRHSSPNRTALVGGFRPYQEAVREITLEGGFQPHQAVISLFTLSEKLHWRVAYNLTRR